MCKVQCDGAKINVTEWGDGPPALLIHGNPDTGIMWEGIASRLGAHYRCGALDLPGFGRSEAPNRYDRARNGMAGSLLWFAAIQGVEHEQDLASWRVDAGPPVAIADASIPSASVPSPNDVAIRVGEQGS